VSRLSGKTVLVTGAGSGVGRGLALACAGAGAAVVLGVRDPSKGNEVVDRVTERGGTALSVACDVTVAGQVDEALGLAADRFGGIDAVIHNAVSAQSSQPVALESAPLSLWDEHARVSITASFHIAQAAFSQLAERRGTLILMTSPAGVDGSEQLSFYAAVKAAQRGLVKSLAREWGPLGVRVNAIAPLAATPAMDRAFAADPQLEGRVRGLIPLGHLGDSELDIGPAAVFLCEEASRYITGQTLVVSGGRFTTG
jgi:3-oxoacyl-[acyl-carrier protein] reductase